jgi:ATP-dependent RNA helicase RhlE
MDFQNLNLNDSLLRAVAAAGFAAPTPIQREAIPGVLAGRDLLGCAQTGTGKTAAFVLPILQRLAAAPPPAAPRPVRVLVLSPTRELATQIGDTFAALGRGTGLTHATIFGGVGDGPQRRALARGVDVVVATPGRLLDLLQQRCIDLRRVEVLVLDEADRMLDAGFLDTVRRIIGETPRARQTLLFSATMPREIDALATRLLRDPVRVAVAPVATPAERIDQAVVHVERGEKRHVLRHLLADPAVTRALVFTRTKRTANRVAEFLSERDAAVDAIHGNKSQAARERALARFRRGTVRVLVATDLAARGIDVEHVSHVINFELPDDTESYVHRIGRTGRAGAAGRALSLCDPSERSKLRDIERLIRRTLPVTSLSGTRAGPPVGGAASGSHAAIVRSAHRPRPHDARPEPRRAGRGRPRRRAARA